MTCVPDPDVRVMGQRPCGDLCPGAYQPSTDNGIGAKWGLDATRPLKYEAHVFTKVRIPGEDRVDLAREVIIAHTAWEELLAD